MKTLIGIQEEYIETVNAGMARWSHRKGIAGIANGVGGHAGRIMVGARRKAEKQLLALGYSQEQAGQAIRDAREMAELVRAAGGEE